MTEVIDCDSHVMEPADLWQRYLEPEFRDRAIRIETRDGIEGTLVSDDIEFELPFGIVGRIAGGFIRRNLSQSFLYRQKRLPEILAAAAQQAVKRA